MDGQLAQGIVRNYLAVQQNDGWIDWKPGLGGQRQGVMCLPVLARLTQNGVWSDRRCTPDLIAQLNRACKRPVDTIICNCIDHEPPLRPNTVFASHFPRSRNALATPTNQKA